MEAWLKAALDYVPQWIELQQRHFEQPGCAFAVALNGEVVLEGAFGVADLATGERLTPRHRFRVASHSKTFTAAGIMKLREHGRLRLDDPVGGFVSGLSDQVAAVTLAQLLSHSAGLVRDGVDAGQFSDRRPFLSEPELRAGLAEVQPLEPSVRFKYSNHGFGLLGLVIEAVTGEPYNSWIAREIVQPAGLGETLPEYEPRAAAPFARGHTSKHPVGRRLVIPGENCTNAMASATGFVSTAADLARFFGQLSPSAKDSVLSVGSRREMARRLWRDKESSLERYYGLGTVSGQIGPEGGGWEWFGHSGGFQGYITRTSVFPAQNLSVSVLTNAVDGLAHPWLDGVATILRTFAKEGAPAASLAGWTSRWWTPWSPVDLLAMGNKVMAFNPAFMQTFFDASEITVTDADNGRISRAPGFGSAGEPVRRVRDGEGRVSEFWLAGSKLVREEDLKAELVGRYGGGRRSP